MKTTPMVDHLTELLAPLGEITAKSMFGGWSIYCNGLTIAVIAEGQYYFKADAENLAKFTDAGQQIFTFHTAAGKVLSMSYYTVPEEALERSASLLPWAKSSLEAAQRAAAKKKPKAPKAEKPPKVTKKAAAKKKLLLPLLVLFSLLGSQLPSLGQEPPLPSRTEEEVTAIPAELLLPAETPDSPAAASLAEPLPVELPAPTQMLTLPPIYAPEGGAAMPEIPNIPGLVLPNLDVRSQAQIQKDEQEIAKRVANGTAPKSMAATLNPRKLSTWIRSPREARQLSISKQRPMILIIAGFDWSPSCKSMNRNLLALPSFKNFTQSTEIVLSYLNVPAKSPKDGDPQKLAEFNAINKYRSFLRVKGLPTIIMFNPDGKELDRTVGFNSSPISLIPTLHDKMNRITGIIETEVTRLEKRESTRKALREIQNYRDWTSNSGTSHFAKISGRTTIENPTETDPAATVPAVTLMDENGKERTVLHSSLVPADQEFIELFWANYDSKKPAATVAAPTPSE